MALGHCGIRQSSHQQSAALEPQVVAGTLQWDPTGRLTVRPAANPLSNGTLGDLGVAAEVSGSVACDDCRHQPILLQHITADTTANVRLEVEAG
jgi:hypothetical protein